MDTEALNFEREKLKETRKWILKETKVKKSDEEKLRNKISDLKKAAKGKYDIELETSKKLYEIVSKNLNHFEDGYKEPYFARIDFREYKREKESLYIGKFGLGDSETGDEIVIDWRSPIADLYYSGTQGEAYYKAPIGVINGELSLKRKFLYKDGEIEKIFDEGINEIILKSSLGEETELVDEFLKINLEQSIGNKLKDVVATIQKEQNEIIRADKNSPIIVQGSAGSGKTTVALHRLAYLLYRFKDKLNGNDILVLAPNKLFLDYISEVLPNLGVDQVKQQTFDEMAMSFLKIKGKVFSKDKKLGEILEGKNKEDINFITESSNLKGSYEFKKIIDKYVKSLEEKDLEISDIKVCNYVLVSKNDIKKLYCKDMINLPLNKRKDEIKRYLNLKLKSKIVSILDKVDFQYEYQVARLKKQMEDSIERRKKLIKIYDERDNLKKEIRENSKKQLEEYFKEWKGIDTKNLYVSMLNDEEIFKYIDDKKISKSLWNYTKESVTSNFQNGIIDSDDLGAMLYLKFLVEGLDDKKKFKHIVIDEAQDYSFLQLYVTNMICKGNSLTIVGDIGQGIYSYKGINSWREVIDKVYNNQCNYNPLTQSYRSTVEIIDFANEVLKKQDNSLNPAQPVLRHGDKPKIYEICDTKDFIDKIDKIVEKVLSNGKNSVAIIGRNYEECKEIMKNLKKYSEYKWSLIREADKEIKLDRIVIPSYLTKGLEFDCSIVYNCSEEVYKNDELDKKLLYVVLTRALHYEYIFYKGNISPLLSSQ